MEVHIVEFTTGDGFQDDVGCGVGGKPQEADAAFLLQLAGGGHATVLLQRPAQKLPVIDPVQREEIDVLQTQILHRPIKCLEELPGAGHRGHLGLDDDFVPRQRGQDAPQLHFRGAIAARCFDMVNPPVESPMDDGLQIVLIFGRNVSGWDILPFKLVTHAAAGINGQAEFGPAKTSVFHAENLCHGSRRRAMAEAGVTAISIMQRRQAKAWTPTMP